jgi:HSP20 family protein
MSGKNKEKKNKSTDLVRRPMDAPAIPGSFPFFGATPFTMMRRFMDDMDRLFDDFGGLRTSPYFEANELAFPVWDEVEKAMWSPQIEILKRNGKMIVRADLPGLKLEDIDLEITDGALTLSGERHEESEEKKEGFYRTERSYGSFYRSIPLPDSVKPENATANFANGVLEVTIAIPAAEPNARKIEIKASEPEIPKVAAATT